MNTKTLFIGFLLALLVMAVIVVLGPALVADNAVESLISVMG